jgi:hypothetical protein
MNSFFTLTLGNKNMHDEVYVHLNNMYNVSSYLTRNIPSPQQQKSYGFLYYFAINKLDLTRIIRAHISICGSMRLG